MDVFWGLTAAAWTAVAAIGTMASAISAAGTPMTNTSQNRLDL